MSDSIFLDDEGKTPEECMEAVRREWYKLAFVENQTPEMCMEAIKANSYAIDHVKNQTPEMCIEAVKKDGSSLCYVREQTPEICKVALEDFGYALEYVKHQTPELCMIAVKRHGKALQFVNKQTPEICVEAIFQDWGAMVYVDADLYDEVQKILYTPNENIKFCQYCSIPKSVNKVKKCMDKNGEHEFYLCHTCCNLIMRCDLCGDRKNGLGFVSRLKSIDCHVGDVKVSFNVCPDCVKRDFKLKPWSH